jgi:hypothetical protein
MTLPTLTPHTDAFATAASADRIERAARALVAQAAEIRHLTAAPDVVVGCVSAVTEDGTPLAVSASGSQLPTYPLEHARARATYGRPSAVNGSELLVVRAEPFPGRPAVLLLREAIGF